MIVIELVGGPHDGRTRELANASLKYSWVELQRDGKGHETIRFFAAPSPRRSFYKMEGSRRIKGIRHYTLLWCQNTMGFCPSCEVFHRREPGMNCSVCDGPIEPVGRRFA